MSEEYSLFCAHQAHKRRNVYPSAHTATFWFLWLNLNIWDKLLSLNIFHKTKTYALISWKHLVLQWASFLWLYLPCNHGSPGLQTHIYSVHLMRSKYRERWGLVSNFCPNWNPTGNVVQTIVFWKCVFDPTRFLKTHKMHFQEDSSQLEWRDKVCEISLKPKAMSCTKGQCKWYKTIMHKVPF